jgi:hypothetical protein
MQQLTVTYRNASFLLARTATGEELRIEPDDIVLGRFREIRPRHTLWCDRDGDALMVYTRDPRTVKETLDFMPHEGGFVSMDVPVGDD